MHDHNNNKEAAEGNAPNAVRSKLLTAVDRYGMIERGGRVIVALSGGADSVTLLHCLNEIKDELGFELSACHVNHNLRGKDSDSDQAYAEELCAKMNIPIRSFSVDVSGTAEKHQSVEERARALRYKVFSEEARRLGARVATAHSSCDNTETVLLNMLRGTGLKGLCGIPPVRDYLIRPLILCTREEIESYCKEKGLGFVTDKTNFSTAYTRNKVRLELIPKLLEINPSLYGGISRMTSALAEDSAFLEALAKERLSEAKLEEFSYSSAMLASLPRPILTRAVSLMLRERDVEPTAVKINGFEEIIMAGKGKVNVEKNKFAVVKKGRAEIQIIVQNYRKRRSDLTLS
ncbi:MAG: tRNA lysidine(34) synthetase TilS [Bacteroides sp.]|nr:tRNA lysidine(34) synthetase TilS [Bacteroides sp.]